jgi:hypothetical protein
LPLLLTTISFLRSLLPRLTATLGAWTLLGLIAVTVLGALLLLLAAFTTTGGSLALVGIAIAVLRALLLLLAAITTAGGSLALIGVAIAILGTATLIGVAVAILGALPLIGIAVAVRRTLPLVGVSITILGALTVVTVTALGRALLGSCSPRRVVTQAALLARAKRTRRGHVPLRPDLGARLPNRRLRSEALTAQVLLAHHDGTSNSGGAHQHARLNVVGAQRPAD